MTKFSEENRKIEVILKSECFVKPKNIANEASNQPYHLGPSDLFLLAMDPIQKGLLFNSKPQNVHSDLLQLLTASVSIALVHFYPLAGRFETKKFPDEHACCIFVDCNKGPGARLIHAALDLKVSDILTSIDVHPIVESFFDLGERLVNHDGHTKPLLSIQVTELLDGVFIGFTINHCVVDGTSFLHFISTLSEIFVQLQKVPGSADNWNSLVLMENMDTISISRKPIFKPFFPDGYGPIVKLPYLEPSEFLIGYVREPFRVRTFQFSHKSISMLKAKANEESGLSNISSFQALIAFVWRSITRARKLQPNIDTSITLMANFRGRLDPPLAQEYFGNFLSPAYCSSKAGELLDNGLGGAAMLINQGIGRTDEKSIRASKERFMQAPTLMKPGPSSPYYKPNKIVVGGSSRFDMYGPEFGLGRAVATLTGCAGKDDGKVTANQGREGAGSVELEVCLKPETMTALESDVQFISFVTTK